MFVSLTKNTEISKPGLPPGQDLWKLVPLDVTDVNALAARHAPVFLGALALPCSRGDSGGGAPARLRSDTSGAWPGHICPPAHQQCIQRQAQAQVCQRRVGVGIFAQTVVNEVLALYRACWARTRWSRGPWWPSCYCLGGESREINPMTLCRSLNPTACEAPGLPSCMN